MKDTAYTAGLVEIIRYTANSVRPWDSPDHIPYATQKALDRRVRRLWQAMARMMRTNGGEYIMPAECRRKNADQYRRTIVVHYSLD